MERHFRAKRAMESKDAFAHRKFITMAQLVKPLSCSSPGSPNPEESPETHNGIPINHFEEERWKWTNYVIGAFNSLKVLIGIKPKPPKNCY